jgi:hypothetical protein
VSPVCDVIKISNGWIIPVLLKCFFTRARRRRKKLLYCDGIQPTQSNTGHTSKKRSTQYPLVPFYIGGKRIIGNTSESDSESRIPGILVPRHRRWKPN